MSNPHQILEQYLNIIERQLELVNNTFHTTMSTYTQINNNYSRFLSSIDLPNIITTTQNNNNNRNIFLRRVQPTPPRERYRERSRTNTRFYFGDRNRTTNPFNLRPVQIARANNLRRFIDSTLNTPSTNTSIPTREQILNATSIVSWNDISNNEQKISPIDRTPFNANSRLIKINHCGHIFKKINLLKWFERNSNCPLCRYDIITQSNQPRRSTSQTQTQSQSQTFRIRPLQPSSIPLQPTILRPPPPPPPDITPPPPPSSPPIDPNDRVINTTGLDRVLTNLTDEIFNSIINRDSSNNNIVFECDIFSTPNSNVQLNNRIIERSDVGVNTNITGDISGNLLEP